MGLETPDGCYFEHLTKEGNRELTHHILLQYHTSWDWLMPVVQKIAENHTFITPYFNTSCKLDGSVFVFGEYVDRKLIKKLKRKGENISLINAVYKQVVEFIKEYNESNKMDILPTSVQ